MRFKNFTTTSVFTIITLLACQSILSANEPVTNSAKPNIVVIMADDMGFGDIQHLNKRSVIATPNLNQLAMDGTVFTDAHSPSAVCTPTRYGLVCGKYCWRTRLKNGVLGGYSKPLVDTDQQTIASVLKKAGYHTGCIGKWHLGLGWKWKAEQPNNINNFGIAGQKGSVDYEAALADTPIHHGFDYSYIIPASLDMSPYVYIKNDRVTSAPNEVIPKSSFPAFYRKGEIAEDFKIVECLDHLTDQAISFVDEQAKTQSPFFLYFPLPAPHKPVYPTEAFKGKSARGDYGDFLMQVDDCVGRFLKSLDKNNIADDTLVIYTSDNGSFMHRYSDDKPDHVDVAKHQGFRPENHTANGELRGTKADIWEGGHRVPFFVRWPAKIKKGQTAVQTITHTDILATVAEVTGADFDKSASPDSFSFLQQAIDSTVESNRPPVIHHSVGGMFAIRKGKWKLVMGNGSGGRQKPRGENFGKPYHLYDIENNIEETSNLIEAHPEIAEKMEAEFESIANGDQIRPQKNSGKQTKSDAKQLWCEYPGGGGPGKGKHIVLIAGDDEYRSEEALPMLGKILSVRHGFKCTVLFPINKNGEIQPNFQTNIPGMEAIDKADLLILGLRFRNLPDKDMKHFVDYVDSGKPIIGIRTSTHAFNYPKGSESAFRHYSFSAKEWKGGFGQQVLGDTWINHHGKHGSESTRGVITEPNKSNPIMNGVQDVWGTTDVYGIRNLPESANVLLLGQILAGMKPDSKPVEDKRNDPMMPIAWTKTYSSKSGNEARIFCTTMGAATDFLSEDLRRLTVNAAFWCLKMEEQIPSKTNVELIGPYEPTRFGFGNFKKGVVPSVHNLKK